MKNNTNIESFAHLRARSSYSIGQSVCTVKELVRKARGLGMSALGLCDCGMGFTLVDLDNREIGGYEYS